MGADVATAQAKTYLIQSVHYFVEQKKTLNYG